jgi:5-methylcytosine-specific restriction endonuclease McrA
MFEGMDWHGFSTDQLEQQLIAAEQAVARLRGVQLEILEVLDRRQVATADGSRSLREWVAARLDLGPDTAGRLVAAMRGTVDRPDLREALADGVSLDRVEALSRIHEDVGLMEHADVAGVRREASRRTRISGEAEFRSSDDRFLVLQPSLDESWWRLWGGLDGASGAIVDKVLSEAADALPTFPDGTRGDASWRRATALVELCVSDAPPPAQVTVFVDTDQATATNGEAGVVLEAGPRVGRRALQAVLCDAVVEVTARASDGTPMVYGRQSRTVPPGLRRAIIARDGGVCAADGCQSRYRLQIHHVTPWTGGGPTNPDNLVTLCWYHHQVVIHQKGYTLYRHPEHGRIRFKRPDRAPPD